MNILRIIKGWSKRLGIISTSTAEKALSDLRLSICAKCPKAKHSKMLVILNGKATYPDSLYCSKCVCPCLEKSLVVDEKCPDKNW